MFNHTVDEVIKSYPKDKWLIWVGAGISYLSPTNLPLGIPLTRFVLNKNCNPQVSSNLETIWNRSNYICGDKSNPQPFGISPRLETLLGVIDNSESYSTGIDYRFMSGFTAFDNAPINLNHQCLAQLLSDGATIITTNFDTCIQSAFSSHVRPGTYMKETQIDHTYRFDCDENDVGSIWHIHGVARDVIGLGATISAVKRGLPVRFTQELQRHLSDGCLLLFFGYSASDSFDVNLFFSRLMERQFINSCAIFFQHGSTQIPLNADILLRPFGNKFKECVDTNKKLIDLSGNSNELRKDLEFDWNDSFLAKSDLDSSKEMIGYITCRLARELGLSYKKLDTKAYQLAIQNKDYFDQWEFHRTLASNCRMIGKSKKELMHDNLAGDFNLLGYNYAHGDFGDASNNAKKIEVIREEAQDLEAELDWDTYTSMSAHCRPIINKYLVNLMLTKIDKSDIKHIEELLELVTILGDRSLKHVVNLNQVATAWRFATLFRAMLHGIDDVETEKNILSLYGEASSIQGYVSSYRDFAIKRILLNKLYGYKCTRGETYSLTRRSLLLSRAIGDVSGTWRALQLLILLVAHKLIPYRSKDQSKLI